MDSLIDTWIFEDEIVEAVEYLEGYYKVSPEIEGAFGDFPPLTFEVEGSFKIYYPDGRVIENPTPKELRAWVEEVKPQIPIYFIDDESEDTLCGNMMQLK